MKITLRKKYKQIFFHHLSHIYSAFLHLNKSQYITVKESKQELSILKHLWNITSHFSWSASLFFMIAFRFLPEGRANWWCSLWISLLAYFLFSHHVHFLNFYFTFLHNNVQKIYPVQEIFLWLSIFPPSYLILYKKKKMSL